MHEDQDGKRKKSKWEGSETMKTKKRTSKLKDAW